MGATYLDVRASAAACLKGAIERIIADCVGQEAVTGENGHGRGRATHACGRLWVGGHTELVYTGSVFTTAHDELVVASVHESAAELLPVP